MTVVILADILSLAQHIATMEKDPKHYRPDRCACCGKANPWLHGGYPRKLDRPSGDMNPVRIPRFYCRNCHRTFSVLPECIPPRRWYLWSVQQAVLIKVLLGESLKAISRCLSPCRSTCRRWKEHFQNQFLLHRSTLTARFPDLGVFADSWDTFWQAVFKEMSLDRAMLCCSQAGVDIP